MATRALLNVTNTQRLPELAGEYIAYTRTVRMHSKTTVSTRESHVKRFVAFCLANSVEDPRLIDIYLLDEFFKDFGSTRNVSTTNTVRRALKSFISWLIEYKEIPLFLDPAVLRDVKVPEPLPKAIDREIVLRVINNCRSPQDRLLICVVYQAGLRISEVTKIKVGDIYGESILIHGKGSIDRTVYISLQLAEDLRQFAKVMGRGANSYLFQQKVHGYGEKLRPEVAARHIKKQFKETAGIEMTAHQLRHSIAVHLLLDGCDLVTIQRQLGHRYITTTQIYLRVADSQVKSSVQSHFDRLMPSSY